MTSKWLIAVAFLAIVLVVLALTARKSVRAELTIDASPEEVWETLTDPTSYAEWNPIFVSVEGRFAEGETLSVGMRSRDGSVTSVAPVVRRLEKNAVLNQTGGIPGMLTFDHTWTLEAVNGGTRVIQREEYRGIGVLFWNPRWVEVAYRRSLIALRDRMENRSVAGTQIVLPYHHDPAGGFRNLPGSPLRNATAGEMSRFVTSELLNSSPEPTLEHHVLPNETAMAHMAAASNPSVSWLGHAAFIVRIAGKIILTDPFIGKTAGPMGIGPKRFVDSALQVDELPKADIMVVSHDHYDHLDAHVIDNYPYKESTQVIVPLGLGPFFEKRGYPLVLEQDWWDTWTLDGLSVTTLPAVHFSGRGLFDRNKTLWASFAFSADDGRIWFSGDTATGEVFSEIGERHGPFDLALVAIGAYEPRSIMRSIHASPEEAIEIARNVGARQAVGMHWGTIRLTSEDVLEPPARFRKAANDQGYGEENALTLRIGETYELPHD